MASNGINFNWQEDASSCDIQMLTFSCDIFWTVSWCSTCFHVHFYPYIPSTWFVCFILQITPCCSIRTCSYLQLFHLIVIHQDVKSFFIHALYNLRISQSFFPSVNLCINSTKSFQNKTNSTQTGWFVRMDDTSSTTPKTTSTGRSTASAVPAATARPTWETASVGRAAASRTQGGWRWGFQGTLEWFEHYLNHQLYDDVYLAI